MGPCEARLPWVATPSCPCRAVKCPESHSLASNLSTLDCVTVGSPLNPSASVYPPVKWERQKLAPAGEAYPRGGSWPAAQGLASTSTANGSYGIIITAIVSMREPAGPRGSPSSEVHLPRPARIKTSLPSPSRFPGAPQGRLLIRQETQVPKAQCGGARKAGAFAGKLPALSTAGNAPRPRSARHEGARVSALAARPGFSCPGPRAPASAPCPAPAPRGPLVAAGTGPASPALPPPGAGRTKPCRPRETSRPDKFLPGSAAAAPAAGGGLAASPQPREARAACPARVACACVRAGPPARPPPARLPPAQRFRLGVRSPRLPGGRRAAPSALRASRPTCAPAQRPRAPAALARRRPAGRARGAPPRAARPPHSPRPGPAAAPRSALCPPLAAGSRPIHASGPAPWPRSGPRLLGPLAAPAVGPAPE